MNRKIEILAPAGSFESLKAGICAGADAVYMGGTRFGARAYADNPDEEQLLGSIDYAHLHGRKLYLTVNTLLKEGEMEELYDYLLPYYLHGVDGVIVQDVGVLSYIRHYFPGLALHASTQMTITGASGASLLKDAGVARVVPARELSLAEIQDIKEKTGLEMECFVHGALCYCYSGQCLFSSLIGGRSGNRGQCAQPCRLPFQTDKEAPGTVLSLKDLCTIEMLPQLIEAGIDSFKIEGRMKQPDYVYTVVSMYRKYTDMYVNHPKEKFKVTQADQNKLLSAYRRRGYTDGYYQRHNGKEMISFGRPGTTEATEAVREAYKIQEKINGKLILSPGKRAKLSLSYGKLQVESEGAVPEAALKQPLSSERVEKQMRKTGGTEFVFEQLDVQVEGQVFLPMQSLNELRRESIERLTQRLLADRKRGPKEARAKGSMKTLLTEPSKTAPGRLKSRISALVSRLEQWQAVAGMAEITSLYVEDGVAFTTGNEASHYGTMVKNIKNQGRKVYLVMPHIFRPEAVKRYDQAYNQINQLYDGIMVRNYESLGWLRAKGYEKEIIPDHHLYVFNTDTKHFFQGMGMPRFTAPMELNERELAGLDITDASLVCYGYMPMMVTANCIAKTQAGCRRREGIHMLTDRYRKEFAVKNNCTYCYNVIYNSAPLVLLNQAEEIKALNPREIRLDFTLEDEAETSRMAQLYIDKFINERAVEMPEKAFTKGHFKRGVK